jgi:hypothetical protein
VNKLVSYNQVAVTLQFEKAVIVVPWGQVQFVATNAGHGEVAVAGRSIIVSTAEAEKLQNVLQLVLKGHPVEDIDFDSED